MRRRRLIGVYRGLRKSIWMPWLRVGSTVRGGGAWQYSNRLTRPHRQTSRSRCRAQSKGSSRLMRRRARITAPDVALTVTPRYARRHKRPAHVLAGPARQEMGAAKTCALRKNTAEQLLAPLKP